MAAGAATTHDVVEEAALPFDRRRHGMILGMGAAGMVIETAEACERRGVVPLAELLGTKIVNSAFHGTRLDANHIAGVMDSLVGEVTANEGSSRSEMASKTVFLSHETYTPARGGSSASEINALFSAFGNDASKIVISNTKGFTGHPMGAGIEDSVAIKALQYGIAPPIANLKEPDEALGDLTLSQGEQRDYRYAIRLAAGFGSQLAITTWKAIAQCDERVPVAQKRADWLRAVTGYSAVEERIEQRTLRVTEATVDKLLPLVPEVSPTTLRTSPAPAPAPTIPAAAAPPTVTAAPTLTPAATAPTADSSAVLDNLLKLIADKTGYETSELEIDFELEADLGIDTVKQAEIFSDLSEQYGLERNDDFRLADYPTIEALAGYVASQTGQSSTPTVTKPAPTPAEPTPAPALAQALTSPAPTTTPASTSGVSYDEMLSSLLGIISAKTGYDTAELELDFELEADLGIDTVKQAEIFSDISEQYGLAQDDDFRLADYPTIETLAKYLTERVNQGDGPKPPAPTAAPVPAPAPVVETSSAAVAPQSASTPAVSTPPAAPRPSAAQTGGEVSYDEMLTSLLTIVSDKTGYDVDELEVDFELEADLGIDTVKQAEIFSEISEKYGLPRDDDFRLADYPTIETLAKYLTEQVASGAARPRPAPLTPLGADLPGGEPAAPVAPVAQSAVKEAASYEDTLADLLAVVAEKTGYDQEELEIDFELEADLGIDTVKQAEIFSDLQTKYALERDDDFRLADYPTIETLAKYLTERRNTSSVSVDTAPAITPTPAAAPEPAAPAPAPVPAAPVTAPTVAAATPKVNGHAATRVDHAAAG